MTNIISYHHFVKLKTVGVDFPSCFALNRDYDNDVMALKSPIRATIFRSPTVTHPDLVKVATATQNRMQNSHVTSNVGHVRHLRANNYEIIQYFRSVRNKRFSVGISFVSLYMKPKHK